MKEHTHFGEKLFSVFFLVFLLGFAAANVFQNGREIREDLAEISWEWADMKQQLQDVEEILNEELLLRYPMIDAYGAIQLSMGKHEQNAFDTVKDKNGFLYSGNFWNGFGDDTKELALRTKRLQQQLEAQGTQFGMILYPMKLVDESARYAGIPYNDFSKQANTYAAWLRYYSVPLLDLRNDWAEAGLTKEQAFFKTDHHWTPAAAFAAYCDILHWMQDTYQQEIPNIDALCDPSQYHSVTADTPLFGSNGRESGLLFAGGTEPYRYLYPKTEGEYLLKVGKEDSFEEYEGSFEQALLDQHISIDSYRHLYELDMNNTYLHWMVSEYASITNFAPTIDKKVLLLRDSFSTPVGAFLAQSFAQVDMLWVGEYSAQEMERYLEENKYDYVFVALYPENLTEGFFPFGIEK